MNNLLASSMSLAIAAFAVQPANAAVTLLVSPDQIATTYLNDFEVAANSGPVTFVTGARQSSASSNGGGTSSGSWGLGVFPPTNIEASLSNYFTHVGMYFGNDDRCCATNFNAILSIYDGTAFLGSVAVAANMNDTADQFIGLSSTTAFNRVIVSYSTDTLFRYIDDFQLGSAATGAIPEPSTWTMLILGFGAMGGALRRRKAQTAVQFA